MLHTNLRKRLAKMPETIPQPWRQKILHGFVGSRSAGIMRADFLFHSAASVTTVILPRGGTDSRNPPFCGRKLRRTQLLSGAGR